MDNSKVEMMQKLIQDVLKKSLTPEYLKDKSLEEILETINIYHQELEFQNVELARVNEHLNISEKNYADLFYNAPVAYVLFDENELIYKSNHAFEKLIGNNSKELYQTNIKKYIHPDYQDGFYFFLKRIKLEDSEEVIELQIKGIQKNTFVLVQCKKTIFWGAGSNELIQMSVTNITDRLKAEEQVRKLSQAMEQSPASVIITDLEGNIEYVNPRFTAVSGYSKEEVLGKNPRILKSGEVPGYKYAEMWHLLKTGSEWRGEFRNKNKNGELYWEFASITPFKNEKGQTTHFLAVKEDITERKLNEEVQSFLAKTGIPGKGYDFFESLSRYLADSLKMEYVSISQFDSICQYAETVAIYHEGHFEHNVKFPINNTICETTINEGNTFHSRKVLELFPNDSRLQFLNAESYCGITLFNSENHPVGSIEMIGILPLKNPAEAAKLLDLLAYRVTAELGKRKADAILFKRLQYEKLLSKISGRAVENISLDRFLDCSLTDIGKTLGVSLLYIFENSIDSGTLSNTHEWCAEGITPQKEGLKKIPTNELNWWVDILKQNKVICYSDIEDIADEEVKGILRPHNILSILVVPLIVDNQYFGFVGFDDCNERRTWPEEDIEIIMSISRIISGTIGRQQAEVALFESEKKYRTLFENMAQGVVYQNCKGKIIHANPSAERILGLTTDQMQGQDSSNFLWHTIREDGSEFNQESNPSVVALRTGKECQAIMGVFNPGRNKYLWLKVNSIPEFSGVEAEPYQVFTTFEDITLLREALDERNLVNHSLEQRVELRTQEILQLSKLQQAILNNAGLAIIAASTDGMISLFNTAAEQMLGYTSDEVIGKFTPVQFHSSDELLTKANELLLRTGEYVEPGFDVFFTLLKESATDTNEWTFIRKDGTKFPIKLTISAIENDLGKVIGYIGIAMDITQEKIANQALQESQERFHKMFHNHAAVMLLVNPETGQIVDANNAAKVFYGYSFSRNESISIFELNSLSKEQIKIEMDNAFAENRNYFQFMHRLSTGEVRTVEVHSTPIEVAGERMLFSIIHDITERWQAELALKNSEKRLNQITDSIQVFISLANRNLEYIFVNKAYERFFNLSKSEILGKNVKELISEEAYNRAFPHLKEALDGQTCTFENRVRNHEGIEKIIQTTYLPYYEDNLIAGILTTVIDVTDRVQAENLLRKREAENRAILSAVPDFLFRLDKNGVFLASHTGKPDSLYASPDYFLGKKVEEVLPPEIAAIVINALAETFEIHDTITFEYELSINGELRYYENRILEISDNEALSIIRDITDRKLAEIGLQTTSKKLTILLQNLRSGTLFEDETRHVTLANQSFCDLFKIQTTPEQLAGLYCEEVSESSKLLMKDPDAYVHRISEILSCGEIVVNDELFLADGRVIERDYVPIWHHNSLLGHLWNYRDITNRKAMEQALRDSEERWNFALEGSGDGVWDWNTQTNEVFFSHQWKSMFGYSDSEIGNTLDEWDKRVHPDDKEKCYADLGHHFSGESDFYINEHRVLCKDGSYKWILDRGKVVKFLPDGKPSRVIGTHTDISTRKQLEESLLATVAKEKELNDLKSRFVSVASHEFRTPLATILITDEALLAYWKRMDQSQIDSRLQIIKDQVVHLTNVVTDVMQIAKIQEGKISVELKEIDLLLLCNETISNFKINFPQKDLIKFNSNFQELKMLLDNRIMVQVLNNLISNAIKYSVDNPSVIVELSEMKDEIVLGVTDGGIGIAEADQKFLFQPFYRASNVDKISGNGLGLNIVKESLHILGCEITLKSTLGKGTTFYVHLPKKMIVSMIV